MKKSPKLRLVISYADTNQKHLGIIYQASNWIYAGMTPNSKAILVPNGRVYHSRMIRKRQSEILIWSHNKIRDKWAIDNCKEMILLGKHRYLYPLDEAMRKQIEPLSKPYPKRQPVEVISNQGNDGGSTPTLPLQKANHD